MTALLADATAGALPAPAEPEPAAFEALVRQRQGACVSFADWKRLDTLEVERGKAQGRPRVKFTSVEAMVGALAGT